jgi:hypothetical protein
MVQTVSDEARHQECDEGRDQADSAEERRRIARSGLGEEGGEHALEHRKDDDGHDQAGPGERDSVDDHARNRQPDGSREHEDEGTNREADHARRIT